MKEKFTQADWFLDIESHGVHVSYKDPAGFHHRLAWLGEKSSMNREENLANAYMMSASKELYQSEKENLEILKIDLEVYEKVAELLKTDKDVQEAWSHVFPTIPATCPQEAVAYTKERIEQTERILKKARGGE